jgi:extracellular factor (EF) 3-hydroxypalmitic acid methyl ester biosynthesis protein
LLIIRPKTSVFNLRSSQVVVANLEKSPKKPGPPGTLLAAFVFSLWLTIRRQQPFYRNFSGTFMNLLFEHLAGPVIDWIALSSDERRVNKGEVLIAEGQTNDALYVVLEGLFDLVMWGNRRLDVSGPGDLVGETALVDAKPSSVSVVASEPSLVLSVPLIQLRSAMDDGSLPPAEVYRMIAAVLAEKLRLAQLRLYATETALEGTPVVHPEAKRMGEAIDKFRGTMLNLDKEALKHGNLPEESFQRFFDEAMQFMHFTHTALGSDSPLTEPVREQLGYRLQGEMLPYIMSTETADRFYSKPRGYAGDYLAIDGMYRNQPAGKGRLGPMVDRMFLQTPPAVAVRNRRKLLADEIVNAVQESPTSPVNVLCLASGPATEIFDAYARIPDKNRLRVTLLDIDIQALAHVDELRTKHRLTAQITLRNENLISLILGRAKLSLPPQHLVYSIGLVDYLNDRLVEKTLNYAHSVLAPGGRVILGNFHPLNPAKEFMDYVLDWKLTHRTEEDMNRLFTGSAFGRPCTRIVFEEGGINLFAECTRDAERPAR